METKNKEVKQVGQKYSLVEIALIETEAERQHLKVATFIRKCVLDKIRGGNN